MSVLGTFLYLSDFFAFYSKPSEDSGDVLQSRNNLGSLCPRPFVATSFWSFPMHCQRVWVLWVLISEKLPAHHLKFLSLQAQGDPGAGLCNTSAFSRQRPESCAQFVTNGKVWRRPPSFWYFILVLARREL